MMGGMINFPPQEAGVRTGPKISKGKKHKGLLGKQQRVSCGWNAKDLQGYLAFIFLGEGESLKVC